MEAEVAPEVNTGSVHQWRNSELKSNVFIICLTSLFGGGYNEVENYLWHKGFKTYTPDHDLY